MEVATVEYLLLNCLPAFDLGAYDYYIYNNQYNVPIEVDLDDMIERTEGLLHICSRGVDPRDDRISRPESVIPVRDLFEILDPRLKI